MNEIEYKFTVFNLTEKDIRDIKLFCAEKKESLEVIIQNTSGITSLMAKELLDLPLKIRVKGSFDDDHLKKYQDNDYIANQNIYNPQEFYHIIYFLEDLDSLINPFLKPLPVTYFIYNYLRFNITLDNSALEYNSLLGLLSKRTTSSGFAIIFKEILDRRKIPCDTIFGPNYLYALNSITIGKYSYLVNLGLDSYLAKRKFLPEVKYFSNMDLSDHYKQFKPSSKENISSYNEFTYLYPKTIEILEELTLKKSKVIPFITMTRSDNSTLLIAKMETESLAPSTLKRYFIADIESSGKIDNHKLIYTEEELIKEFSKDEKDFIANKFLARERLENLINSGNNYIGYISNNEILESNQTYTGKVLFKKYPAVQDRFLILEKTYAGRAFIYNYFELNYLKENGYQFYQGEIITTIDLFLVNKKEDISIVNTFLKRDNIKKATSYLDGYLGGNPDLLKD